MLTITSSGNLKWEQQDSNLRTLKRFDLQSNAIATMRYSQFTNTQTLFELCRLVSFSLCVGFEYKVGIEPTPQILQTCQPPRPTYTFVTPPRFEFGTPSLKVMCSNQLSYEVIMLQSRQGSNLHTLAPKARDLPIGQLLYFLFSICQRTKTKNPRTFYGSRV